MITVNPFVGGSSPPRGAKLINQDTSGCLFLCLKINDSKHYSVITCLNSDLSESNNALQSHDNVSRIVSRV
jgi:hypothetical protein